MPLPEWLMEDAGPPPPTGGRQRKSWLSKSIERLLSLSSRICLDSSGGILKIGPRAALLGFITLIVSTTLLKHPLSLLFCWMVALVVAILSGARPRLVFAASIAIGFLTVFMMLPAMTSLVTKGTPIVDLGPFSITLQGVLALSSVALRTMACVIFGIGLFSSNRAEDLFEALRSFRVPGMFVAILILTYRYLQVVLRAALEVHTARKSRLVRETGLSDARIWIGEQIGGLFSRSYALGDEVHASMTARGFDGEWIPAPASSPAFRDIIFSVICIVIAIGFYMAEWKRLV